MEEVELSYMSQIIAGHIIDACRLDRFTFSYDLPKIESRLFLLASRICRGSKQTLRIPIFSSASLLEMSKTAALTLDVLAA